MIISKSYGSKQYEFQVLHTGSTICYSATEYSKAGNGVRRKNIFLHLDKETATKLRDELTNALDVEQMEVVRVIADPDAEWKNETRQRQQIVEFTNNDDSVSGRLLMIAEPDGKVMFRLQDLEGHQSRSFRINGERADDARLVMDHVATGQSVNHYTPADGDSPSDTKFRVMSHQSQGWYSIQVEQNGKRPVAVAVTHDELVTAISSMNNMIDALEVAHGNT